MMKCCFNIDEQTFSISRGRVRVLWRDTVIIFVLFGSRIICKYAKFCSLLCRGGQTEGIAWFSAFSICSDKKDDICLLQVNGCVLRHNSWQQFIISSFFVCGSVLFISKSGRQKGSHFQDYFINMWISCGLLSYFNNHEMQPHLSQLGFMKIDVPFSFGISWWYAVKGHTQMERFFLAHIIGRPPTFVSNFKPVKWTNRW